MLRSSFVKPGRFFTSKDTKLSCVQLLNGVGKSSGRSANFVELVDWSQKEVFLWAQKMDQLEKTTLKRKFDHLVRSQYR